MTQIKINTKKVLKQRLTAFIDPLLVKRAKIRGALEGLTISQVVEKALEEYAPKIERDLDQHIHLKFMRAPIIDKLLTKNDGELKRKIAKHSKTLVVP